MDSRFLKYLFPAISFSFLFFPALGQVEYKNVERCIRLNYPQEDLRKYSDIFIIRFGFCNGSRYCGGYLYRYINRVAQRSEGQILIITPDTTQEIIRQLGTQQNMVVRYINTQSLETYAGFSAYNIYINKKRKVKRLI